MRTHAARRDSTNRSDFPLLQHSFIKRRPVRGNCFIKVLNEHAFLVLRTMTSFVLGVFIVVLSSGMYKHLNLFTVHVRVLSIFDSRNLTSILVLNPTRAQNCLTSSDGTQTCYTLMTSSQTADAAAASCRSSGQILARIENDAQSNLIKTLVTSGGRSSVWIGASVFEHGVVDEWRWLDGQFRTLNSFTLNIMHLHGNTMFFRLHKSSGAGVLLSISGKRRIKRSQRFYLQRNVIGQFANETGTVHRCLPRSKLRVRRPAGDQRTITRTSSR